MRGVIEKRAVLGLGALVCALGGVALFLLAAGAMAWVALPVAAASGALGALALAGQRDAARRQRLTELAVMAGGLAHELRHPINAVRFALASLASRVEKTEPSAAREDALRITREVREDLVRLEEIIDAFLRYAKPESAQPERVDLRSVVEATARFLRAEMTNRGLALRVEKPDVPVWTRAPEIHLRHALMNLIVNAAEASSEGGEIVVRVERARRKARVEVEDRGAGVPPDKVARIFEPFFTTKESGAGLGLAICRRLVTDAGGQVSYRPASPRGSVFAVELPLDHRERGGRAPGTLAETTGRPAVCQEKE
ncbi:MAG TPA: HAMP domain-containing sensor histidine kinase [Candidatus Brocadiia bacterium]|nr:HAMP domain-containing sensor histidine kinase [Candidatus Brocadiia bacterium]